MNKYRKDGAREERKPRNPLSKTKQKLDLRQQTKCQIPEFSTSDCTLFKSSKIKHNELAGMIHFNETAALTKREGAETDLT